MRPPIRPPIQLVIADPFILKHHRRSFRRPLHLRFKQLVNAHIPGYSASVRFHSYKICCRSASDSIPPDLLMVSHHAVLDAKRIHLVERAAVRSSGVILRYHKANPGYFFHFLDGDALKWNAASEQIRQHREFKKRPHGKPRSGNSH